MKNILKNIAPFSLFFMSKKTWKKIGESIFLIILPLLLVTIGLGIATTIGMFVTWDLPERWYFPFTGGYSQMIFDRSMIVCGIIILILGKTID